MITIRAARRADVHVMLNMLRASAAEQGFPEALAVTEANLLEDGFSPHPRFHCVFAEIDGAPAGMALFFFNYSTWVSRFGLYLEDLYVDPNFRRAGVASALLLHLRGLANKEGCGRLQWVVHRANQSAIRLYRSFGAQPLDDWILMTVKQDSHKHDG